MIAIRNIEMPKSCSECPMFHEGLIGHYCRITWVLLNYPQYCEERDKTCPLVPCIGIIRGYKEHKPNFDFEEVEKEW